MPGRSRFSDIVTALFLVAFALDALRARRRTASRRAAGVAFGFFVAFPLVYLIGFFNLETAQALAQWAKGMIKFVLHFAFLVAGVALVARRGERFYWLDARRRSAAGSRLNGLYGVIQLAYAELTRRQPRRAVRPADHRRRQQDQHLRRDRRARTVYRVERAHRRPEPPRDRALDPDPRSCCRSTCGWSEGIRWRRKRSSSLLAFLAIVQLATLSRSGILGLVCGLVVLAIPYHRLLFTARFLVPLGGSRGRASWRSRRSAGEFFQQVLRARFATEGGGTSTHFVVYSFIPDVLSHHPFFGLGLNNFSVYYEFVTGRTNFGPHSFYVALFVETGIVGATLFGVFVVYLFRRSGATRRIGRALAGARRPARRPCPPARLGPHGGARRDPRLERLLPDDDLLLLLRRSRCSSIAPPAVFGRRLGRGA